MQQSLLPANKRQLALNRPVSRVAEAPQVPSASVFADGLLPAFCLTFSRLLLAHREPEVLPEVTKE